MNLFIIAAGLLVSWLLLWRLPVLSLPNHKTIGRRVSVIIPARDEAHNIKILLKSLFHQSHQPYEIIVADDHSTDGTAIIAEEKGAASVNVRPLPEGWHGKPWACAEGARAATGDLLLFVDADVTVQYRGIEKLAFALHNEDLDVLTIQPYHDTKRIYEQFSAFFQLISVASIGEFIAGMPSSFKKGGFGPVLMLDRRQYETLGGHERVKSDILEHYVLCEHAREQGLKVGAFIGEGCVHYRMYPNGFRTLIQGWSKSFALGAVKTPWQVFGLIILWISGCVTLTTSLAGILTEPLHNQIILGLFYIAYAATITVKLSKIGRFQRWTTLLFPVPLLFFVMLFIFSVFLSFGRRRVVWKGRHISVGTKEQD